MNQATSKVATCCTLILGAGLWGGMAQKFNSEEALAYEPNVACVKGSPYGKILALAMQGSVDFYWHKGKTHEDEAILATGHQHDAGCADGCDDHAGHDHGVEEHAEGCGCGAHGHEPPQVATHEDEPFREIAKLRIKQMAASAHRKTDGKPLSAAHQKYLQGVTEDKLRLAYELDPSNYTNYGNYHLFIASTTYGRSEGDDDAAVALARRTLEFCKRDQTDPASWVTAASAAYNIIFHIGRYYQGYSIEEAKASLAEFDFCIDNYVRLRREALEAGRIVSVERVKEMEERVRYLIELRKAQGIYMKRVMSTKMANALNSERKIN
ncbi:MAG: hypothetical protein H7A51_19015 [Akkermansiaceae bacterium]|nr:hypothetical protein [Akkermansiaceae bacterium]